MIFVVEGHRYEPRLYAYSSREKAERSSRAIGGRVVPYVASVSEHPSVEQATREALEWHSLRDSAEAEAEALRHTLNTVTSQIKWDPEVETLGSCLCRVARKLRLADAVIREGKRG